ncbi:SDR family NAD(P)-dependent oxidoreductase [Rhizobium terrae]|uniref:SDR family NAD(P)-dependent oxidoreductase n=1 Tax=Rhizobium terrae TaxID=2171756 RepID=UPI000E3C84D4|nr:SDR family NAD(P)-dependent oxidoreductase [Rhizobium terrae]
MAPSTIQHFRKLGAQPLSNAPNKAYGGEFTGEAKPPADLPWSFIVFRHAQTAFNLMKGQDPTTGETTFYAQGRGVDPPIDEVGMCQALAGGYALRGEVIDHVLCSLAKRATMTVFQSRISRGGAEFTLHDCLQEHSFGNHEGKMLSGKGFSGPYPGVEDPVKYTKNFIVPGLDLVREENTVVVTHGGWFKGAAGVLRAHLLEEHVGNAVPVRLKYDGSGWKATRLRAIVLLALCMADMRKDGETVDPGQASDKGLEPLLEEYGLTLSTLKPRALVVGENGPVIAEMRHGLTIPFDLDLRTNGQKGEIDTGVIEDQVKAILIARPDIGALRLMISSHDDYSKPDGPATRLLRVALDHFIAIGKAWNVDFEDVTLPKLDEMILSTKIGKQLARPRGVSTTSDNRVILISGANRGIGLAIARALILAGHLVSLGARDVAALAAIFGEQTERIQYARFDAEDDTTSKAWVSDAMEKFGRIDGLVNNAGCGASGKANLMDGDPRMTDLLFQVHVTAQADLVRLCMPHLETTGAGRIVFINSLSAMRVRGSVNLGYNMAKGAQLALAHTTHNQAWEKGVRVTSICPGWVNTELSAHSKIPNADKTQPADVAAIVAFLMRLPNTADLGDIPVNCEFEPKR